MEEVVIVASKTLTSQVSPSSLTAAHKVGNPVIFPPVLATTAQGFVFSERSVDADAHEFLFRLVKNKNVFWVGAMVPKGTIDFTGVHVYFHPTVVNGKSVHAKDSDYKDFKGGWSASIQRYVAMQGGQLAAAGLKIPFIVPFTTMAAVNTPTAATNMFFSDPVETLNSLMDAIQAELLPAADGTPPLTRVGVSSFSSGISALRFFLSVMGSSRLVKEVNDFDSPQIIREPKKLTRSPGARSRCFTQVALSPAPTGWITLTTTPTPDKKARFLPGLSTFSDKGPHAQIGWMTFFSAMSTSVVR